MVHLMESDLTQTPSWREEAVEEESKTQAGNKENEDPTLTGVEDWEHMQDTSEFTKIAKHDDAEVPI
eukprot:13649994-Ditylum_brightwellii.AAC.1